MNSVNQAYDDLVLILESITVAKVFSRLNFYLTLPIFSGHTIVKAPVSGQNN